MKIAILGGTGKEGAGLGYRWAVAGHHIIIGSRVAERAEAKAAELTALLPGFGEPLQGMGNVAAAQAADLVILSVPYEAQKATLEEVKPALVGKLLISVVVPLKPPKLSQVWLPEAGSAAAEAQQLLGEQTRVAAAFQNVSAEHLLDLNHAIACDVLICGDKAADREIAAQLAQDAGMRGIHAGPLVNAGIVEGLTAVLISINIRHKIKHAGIRITGITD
ncbi:MAG: NADPH-dependent F420 reductase [Anaerolineae bacterium]|nr:NADPH-dependent F420 reductase [Anaerolineae bacterium]